MEGFRGRRGNHNQNKGDSIKEEKKKKIFSGPEEKGEERVMLIMCARPAQRENKGRGGGKENQTKEKNHSLAYVGTI